jgi:hypothetical protein
MIGRVKIAIFRSIATVFLIAMGGCASVAVVSKDFVPNEREAIVFGRMEFVVDGTPPPNARFGSVKPAIRMHVSRYSGVGELNRNALKPGEFVLEAPVSDEGYFVAQLPVGEYYVVESVYVGARGGYDSPIGWEIDRTSEREIYAASTETRPAL